MTEDEVKVSPFDRLKTFFGWDDYTRDIKKEIKAARKQASIDAGKKGRANKYTPPMGSPIREYNYNKQTGSNKMTPAQRRRYFKKSNRMMARG